MGAFAVHDLHAILDYSFDWSDWLLEGQSINESTWSGPEGVTLTPSVSNPFATVRVEVTDMELVGQKLSFVNHVVSTDGQEDDRTLVLFISNK